MDELMNERERETVDIDSGSASASRFNCANDKSLSEAQN